MHLAPKTGGAEEFQQYRKFFFSTVYLLPKKTRFEDGGAILVFCPGPQLTSVRHIVNSSQKSHLWRLNLN